MRARLATAALSWAVVGATGCAQLFGIDATSGEHAADAGIAVDAAPMSSLTYTRYSIGASIVTAPQDLSGLGSAEFFTAGGALLPNTVTSANTWSAVGTSAQVDYELPDLLERTLALSTSNISDLFGVLEHPGSVAAPTGAAFTVSATLPSAVVAGESFQVLTLGSWTNFVLTAPAVGATTVSQSYPFSSVTSLTGGPLQAIAPVDAVLLLRFDGDQLTGLYQVPAFDQLTSPSQTVQGAIAALPASATATATIAPATALARMAAAVPATTAATSLNWSLVAAPGYQVASTSGVLLNAAAETSASTAISAGYTDVFDAMGWNPVLTWAPTASRTATVDSAAGALPVSMFTQLAEFMDASTGALDASLPAGQPLAVTLAGSALDTDNATIALDPTQPQPVSFTADVATNTLYQLQVFELVPSPPTGTATSLVFQTVLAATAVAPSFTLPANTFTVGQSYVIRAICLSGGFSAVASGDLTQRQLPLSRGLLDAGAFTVVAMP